MKKQEERTPNKFLVFLPIVVVLSLIMIFFMYSGSIANAKLTVYKNVRETIDKNAEEFKSMAWAVVESEYNFDATYEDCKVSEGKKLWFNNSYYYARYVFKLDGKRYVVIMPYSFEDESYLK